MASGSAIASDSLSEPVTGEAISGDAVDASQPASIALTPGPRPPVYDLTPLPPTVQDQLHRLVQLGRIEEARSLLRQPARSGSITAMRLLALIDVRSAGSDRSPSRALPRLRTAFDQGDGVAGALLAREVAFGQGTHKDQAEAEAILRRVHAGGDRQALLLSAALWSAWADAGVVSASRGYGQALAILSDLEDTDPDRISVSAAHAIVLLRSLSADPELAAAERAARLRTARALLEQAWSQGDVYGAMLKAHMLAEESDYAAARAILAAPGLESDPLVLRHQAALDLRMGDIDVARTGLQQLGALASGGDTGAALALADAARRGRDGLFPADPGLAQRWYQFVADQGHPKGWLGLGRLALDYGDRDRAKIMFARGAKAGHRGSMIQLAQVMESDPLGISDPREAQHWRERAALPVLGLSGLMPFSRWSDWHMPLGTLR